MTGSADDPRLLALAEAIANSERVDWDHLPFTPAPEHHSISKSSSAWNASRS